MPPCPQCGQEIPPGGIVSRCPSCGGPAAAPTRAVFIGLALGSLLLTVAWGVLFALLAR